jgi:hypothetical protein
LLPSLNSRQLYYRINHDVLDSLLDAIKKGCFTSARPKNKKPRKHSEISKVDDVQQTALVCSPSTNLSADGQQTALVCSPSTNLSADGQQTSLPTVNNPSCSPSTNSIYIETENITKTTTEREEQDSLTLDLQFGQEISLLFSESQPDQTDFFTPSTQPEQLEKPEQPDPSPQTEQPQPDFSFSLSNSESTHQTENLKSGSIVPGSFDNHEQSNLADFSTIQNNQASLEQGCSIETAPTTHPVQAQSFQSNSIGQSLELQPIQDSLPNGIALSSREVAKIQHYQQLDADGIKLKQPELRDWARLEIGQYIRTYRKSGFILTGGNDVSGEFAVYVAKQNCRKGQEPTISLGFNVINKCESNPRCWQKLVVWVTEWQQLRQTGQQVNVAQVVNEQQQMQRIRQAASTKFEL